MVVVAEANLSLLLRSGTELREVSSLLYYVGSYVVHPEMLAQIGVLDGEMAIARSVAGRVVSAAQLAQRLTCTCVLALLLLSVMSQ